MTKDIDWISGSPPIAAPECGFRGEKCICKILFTQTTLGIHWRYNFSAHTMEISCGVTGGILIVITIIGLILYRNWKYEQELDSLLWKVDFKEIQINDEANSGSKSTRVSTPVNISIHTSRNSLQSFYYSRESFDKKSIRITR